LISDNNIICIFLAFFVHFGCILIAAVHVCIRDYIKPLANFREAAFFIFCGKGETAERKNP